MDPATAAGICGPSTSHGGELRAIRESVGAERKLLAGAVRASLLRASVDFEVVADDGRKTRRGGGWSWTGPRARACACVRQAARAKIRLPEGIDRAGHARDRGSGPARDKQRVPGLMMIGVAGYVRIVSVTVAGKTFKVKMRGLIMGRPRLDPKEGHPGHELLELVAALMPDAACPDDLKAVLL